jgi:hypothetical protein
MSNQTDPVEQDLMHRSGCDEPDMAEICASCFEGDHKNCIISGVLACSCPDCHPPMREDKENF